MHQRALLLLQKFTEDDWTTITTNKTTTGWQNNKLPIHNINNQHLLGFKKLIRYALSILQRRPTRLQSSFIVSFFFSGGSRDAFFFRRWQFDHFPPHLPAADRITSFDFGGHLGRNGFIIGSKFGRKFHRRQITMGVLGDTSTILFWRCWFGVLCKFGHILLPRDSFQYFGWRTDSTVVDKCGILCRDHPPPPPSPFLFLIVGLTISKFADNHSWAYCYNLDYENLGLLANAPSDSSSTSILSFVFENFSTSTSSRCSSTTNF